MKDGIAGVFSDYIGRKKTRLIRFHLKTVLRVIKQLYHPDWDDEGASVYS